MRPTTCVHLVGAALAVAALGVWWATGAEAYTRWPDARLAHADAPPAAGESELLAQAGFTDERAAPARPDIRSRFALGLLPGGVDPRHLLAVATIAVGAAGASVIVVVLGALRRRHARANAIPVTEGDRR